MTEQETTRKLLREIRDMQAEMLELSRQHHAMSSRQFERVEALHERAEKIQDRSESIMAVARKSLVVIIPVIVGLLIYLSWLIFR